MAISNCADSNSGVIAAVLQILVAKVLTTAICRSSGLVGGVYAPSIFLGVALGLAYGQGVHLVDATSGLVEISPQQVRTTVSEKKGP